MHDGATPAAFAVEPIDGGIVLAGEIDIAAADAVRAELAALGGLGCGVVAAVTSVAALWFVSFAPKYSIATRTADDVVSLVLVALSLAAVLVVVRRLDLARLRAARARR